MAKKTEKRRAEDVTDLAAPATLTPEQVALNRAAVKRLGRKTTAEVPDFGECVFYAWQPEQITAIRARLLGNGMAAADQILLDKDHADYQRHRRVLAHLPTTCCREPIPGNEQRLRLRFPGGAGITRWLGLDDNRLVAIARLLVKFNEVFAPPPAS